jgi:hypothetical protein
MQMAMKGSFAYTQALSHESRESLGWLRKVAYTDHKRNLFCEEWLWEFGAKMLTFLNSYSGSSVLLTQGKRILSLLQMCEDSI